MYTNVIINSNIANENHAWEVVRKIQMRIMRCTLTEGYGLINAT